MADLTDAQVMEARGYAEINITEEGEGYISIYRKDGSTKFAHAFHPTKNTDDALALVPDGCRPNLAQLANKEWMVYMVTYSDELFVVKIGLEEIADTLPLAICKALVALK